MNKKPMKIIETTLVILMVALVVFSLISAILIGIAEWPLYLNFTSKGFSYFLSIYSFPIKLLSASVAVLSVWAVAHNIYRARLTFVHNQLTQELYKCEDEIKEIANIKFGREDVINMLKYKLRNDKNSEYAYNYFYDIKNDELAIEEIIPHLSKLGIYESHGVYQPTTQRLTLRLKRYAIILLELSEVAEDKMLVKYYANKHIPLMIDLHHYQAEIDLKMILMCYQFASIDLKYNFDFSKINGERHIQVTERFLQLVESSNGNKVKNVEVRKREVRTPTSFTTS